MKITLPDGSVRKLEVGSNGLDIANDIGAGLAKAALAGKVNGKLVDTSYVMDSDADLAIITERDEDGLEIIRHSTAHLLAQAVQRLFDNVQVTIGPVIDHGFYYDFATEKPFTEDDLRAIEKEMEKISKENLQVERTEMERDEAVAFFRNMGEEYKAEIIESIPSNEASELDRSTRLARRFSSRRSTGLGAT